MTPPPNGFRVPWVVLIGFLLALMGAGYVHLDLTKADRRTVEEMAKDIRELRVYFLGPKQAGPAGPVP